MRSAVIAAVAGVALLAMLVSAADIPQLPLPVGPKAPNWPVCFVAPFTLLSFSYQVVLAPGGGLEQYSGGALWYDFKQYAQRNDHYGWCFDFGNYSCSFLLLGDLYFVSDYSEPDFPGCCKLMTGIGPSPPNWVSVNAWIDTEKFGRPTQKDSNHWFFVNDHDYWSEIGGNQSLVAYSDSGFGTPRQWTYFHDVEVYESLPKKIFNLPGPQCQNMCPDHMVAKARRVPFPHTKNGKLWGEVELPKWNPNE
jgi:hypothetical protein